MHAFLGAVVSLALAAPTVAAEGPASAAWREMARIDGEAALALIADNHPGAAPSLGDRDFQQRLAAARLQLRDRLPKVSDYGSYSALMLGLANAFGDGHVWTSGKIAPQSVNWPGLVSVRRAGTWRVGLDEREGEHQDLTGSEIVRCDGTAAEALGLARVGGFQADPASEAAIAGKAYSLLLDSGNPWAPPLKRCTFRLANGKSVDADLDWTPIRSQDLQPKLIAALHPARAGMGISDFGKGAKWIALETLSQDAAKVVEEAGRRAAELRAAPLVVVDLRGNGGGNSDYARTLAATLVGEDRVAATDIKISGCEGAYWRASAGNLEAVRQSAARRSGQAKDYFTELAADMAKAQATGQAFAPALPACAADAAPSTAAPAKRAPSAMKGRLVLLTDRACFSSCLIAADIFRKVGAVHVGETTDRSTRYMEVREVVLPSGLRTFSTLMKAAVGLPDYGPFKPDVAYDGALDDTDALKAWILALKR